MVCKPEILILGSRYDLTCDLVVSALRRKGAPYLRLNSEDLPATRLDLEPTTSTLSVGLGEAEFQVSNETVRSVLFRRPTFLRSYADSACDPRGALLRTHWAAFMRNLVVIESALWVNHPGNTYLAEHKALQLRRAVSLGFAVPRTRVANTVAAVPAVSDGVGPIVVKGLDAVLIREGDRETFGFTQFVEPRSLVEEDLQAAPVILQEALQRKTDFRVTVVGDLVFAVEITRSGERIAGDWRCVSREADYRPRGLPRDVEQRCIELVKLLGLHVGAIDLALQDGTYYFLEINPTGEWAWLVNATGLAIDRAVADALVAGP